MTTEELQHRTTVNIQEKTNLIWTIADKLEGACKSHEYGNVVLPMCVIKRFSDTLAPTEQKVLDTNKQLDARGLVVKKGFLTTASGYDFYNISPFTFDRLLSEPDNIADNLDLSVKNPNKVGVVDERTPEEIAKEIVNLNTESQALLEEILKLL